MWLEVASGPDRGRAVEVGGEPVTIGSGTGCALVVHDARVEPLHASARALRDGVVEVAETGGASHILRAGDELTLGGDARLRVSAASRPATTRLGPRHAGLPRRHRP